jgi:hypothetical protein
MVPPFFNCINIIRKPVSAGDEGKNSTAEHAETAEIFFIKSKNLNHFMDISFSLRPPGSLRFMVIFYFLGNKNLSFFVSSTDKEKNMPEEEAESAEIIS